MAKKKKHKKSRNSRRHRVESATTQSVSTSDVTLTPEVVTTSVATKTEKATKPKQSVASITYDDVELSYVKTDVIHTLILVGLILSVYAVLWVLVTYTGVGTQLTNLMSYK